MYGPDEQARLAQAFLKFRRGRGAVLPAGLFGETGWEFLLELFIADAAGERLTGRMVVDRSGTTPMTASRWLRYLSSEGLVVGDGDGDLDDLLTLSSAAIEQIETLMSEASVLFDQLADAKG